MQKKSCKKKFFLNGILFYAKFLQKIYYFCFLVKTKLIHLGVCLPFSCTASDVTVIGKLAASEFAAKHSTIEKVRDQHNLYDMYSDPVFWILS